MSNPNYWRGKIRDTNERVDGIVAQIDARLKESSGSEAEFLRKLKSDLMYLYVGLRVW
jgi:hypothetical protein